MTQHIIDQTHKAAVLYGAKNLHLEPVQTPALKSDEVRISPRATGICGTDLHYYQNGRNGIYEVQEPLILGHEAAGEVVAVGADVKSLKVGDRVVVEPQIACSSCKQCRSGKYNLCPKMRFNGSASAKPPSQGSLQTLWNHPAYLCYRLPDSVSFAEGAMVEPLSVALHSVRKSGIHAGQSVLITGAGAIGLLCARVAKISGASHITMIDVDDARLEFARLHRYADETLKIPFSSTDDESMAQFAARMANQVKERSEVAFECTGVETCLNICINASSQAGRVIQVGMGQPMQNVHLGVALVREVEIMHVWRYTNTFQPAIDLIKAGMVDVKSMITHQFSLDDITKALEFALSRPADLVKCIITSNE